MNKIVTKTVPGVMAGALFFSGCSAPKSEPECKMATYNVLTIQPGETIQLALNGKISAIAGNVAVKNTACLIYGPDAGNTLCSSALLKGVGVEEWFVDDVGEDMQMKISTLVDGQKVRTAQPDDKVGFTITFTNIGDTPQNNVYVYNKLPQGITFEATEKGSIGSCPN